MQDPNLFSWVTFEVKQSASTNPWEKVKFIEIRFHRNEEYNSKENFACDGSEEGLIVKVSSNNIYTREREREGRINMEVWHWIFPQLTDNRQVGNWDSDYLEEKQKYFLFLMIIRHWPQYWCHDPYPVM